jgi:response regulator of citrate/malate metabolism
MNSETLNTIGAILGILIPIILFIVWHFRTVNSFEKQVNELKLQMKELENKDNLQQQTIDQLNQLYPLFEKAFQSLNKGKK